MSSSQSDEPEWEEVTAHEMRPEEAKEEDRDSDSENGNESDDNIEEVNANNSNEESDDKEAAEADEDHDLFVIKVKATVVAFTLNSLTTTALFPVELARTLMRAGYEPKGPVPGLSLFGRPCLILPNLFQYIRYIKSVDGITGCFRGLVPYLVYRSVDMIIFLHFNLPLCLKKIIRPDCRTCELYEKEKIKELDIIAATVAASSTSAAADDEASRFDGLRTYVGNVVLDIISCGVSAVFSYPFRVVALHCMASFVGRESSSVMEIVKGIWYTEGVHGFFNGLVPKLIGDVVGAVAVCLVTSAIKLRVADPDFERLLTIFVSPLTTALQYPFSVVSTTMAINGSRLYLGNPPFTPIFSDWTQCWVYLKSLHQLRRGSSFVFRYYTGPVLSVRGILRPTVVHFGPDYSVGYLRSTFK